MQQMALAELLVRDHWRVHFEAAAHRALGPVSVVDMAHGCERHARGTFLCPPYASVYVYPITALERMRAELEMETSSMDARFEHELGQMRRDRGSFFRLPLQLAVVTQCIASADGEVQIRVGWQVSYAPSDADLRAMLARVMVVNLLPAALYGTVRPLTEPHLRAMGQRLFSYRDPWLAVPLRHADRMVRHALRTARKLRAIDQPEWLPRLNVASAQELIDALVPVG